MNCPHKNECGASLQPKQHHMQHGRLNILRNISQPNQKQNSGGHNSMTNCAGYFFQHIYTVESERIAARHNKPKEEKT